MWATGGLTNNFQGDVWITRLRRNCLYSEKGRLFFVIIYGLINAAVIAGIIVYYRLKEQALAGALYLQDNAYGEAFVRKNVFIRDNR